MKDWLIKKLGGITRRTAEGYIFNIEYYKSYKEMLKEQVERLKAERKNLYKRIERLDKLNSLTNEK